MSSDVVPNILVIYGVTGDLVKRMVAPALFHLYETKQMPEKFKVVGFSRRDISNDTFRKNINEAVKSHTGGPDLPSEFLELFIYQQGDFSEKQDYLNLYKRLRDVDMEWGICSNKLFHLAVPPTYYEEILENLSFSELAETCHMTKEWTRIMVEKPFGTNLKEAGKIDAMLSNFFSEEEVYRIDHYLAKELLQNILVFRFANNLLEQVWNERFIEKIEITLLEEIGLEGRGDTYDDVGALLDIGQNHMLQMLALVTMEAPKMISPDSIRNTRRDLFKQLSIPDDDYIEKNTFRGQYSGYLEEPGVKENSRTETYFKIKMSIDSPRWKGVPIFLEAGKRAPLTKKEIAVTFDPANLSFPGMETTAFNKNTIYFKMEPTPGIAIKFWSKRPGPEMALEEQVLDFKYTDIESGLRHLEGYSKLLLDSINGDQTLFITSEEALMGWHFIDPIISAWRSEKVDLKSYSQNDRFYEMANHID